MESLPQLESRFLKGVLQTLINIDFYKNESVTVQDLGDQLVAAVAGLTSASKRNTCGPQQTPHPTNPRPPKDFFSAL